MLDCLQCFRVHCSSLLVQSRSLYPALVVKKELHPVAGVQALHDIATQALLFLGLEAKGPVILGGVGAGGREYKHVEEGDPPPVPGLKRDLRTAKEYITMVLEIYVKSFAHF